MEEQGEWGSQCQEITPADFAQCGYESNYKRCNRLNKCFWEGNLRTGTCVVDMTTDAPTLTPTTDQPTTADFAQCGYESNHKLCKKLDRCFWKGNPRTGTCLVNRPTA